MVGDGQTIPPKPEKRPPSSGRSKRARILAVLGLVLMALLVLRVGATALAFLTGSGPLPSIALSNGSSGGLVKEGKTLYSQQCASCHGAAGDRIPVAPLNSQSYVDSLGDRLEQTITQGRGTMPAWGKEQGGPLDADQMKAVAQYVRASNGLPKTQDSPVVGATTPPAKTAVPVAATQPQAPPAIPHAFPDQANRCLECHGRGTAAAMPVNHAGRDNSTCSFCHAQGPVTVAAPNVAAVGTPAPTPVGTVVPKR